MNNTEQQFNEFSLELFLEQLTTVNVQSIEQELEGRLEQQLNDYGKLCYDKSQVGNPQNLGQAIADVVWEQFINQIGVTAGEDFIKENRGLRLDLSNDAHIVTIDNYGKDGAGSHNYIIKEEKFITENHGRELDLSADAHIQKTDNFAQGKIATHNDKIDYQQRYNDWRANFQMDANGNIKTKYDRIDNEEKPILVEQKKYRAPYDDARKKAGQVGSGGYAMDEIVPVGELVRRPDTNAHMSLEERVDFDVNSGENTNLLPREANESKGDHKAQNWLNSERNGQKPGERFDIDEEDISKKDAKARKLLDKKIKEGEKKAEETGKQSQKEEEARSIEAGKQSQKTEFFRISGEALKAVLMTLLTALVKEIIAKLIKWFKSGAKTIKTFLNSLKESVCSFIDKLKQYLKNATDSLLTTIATALLGPIVGFIKKAWILIKQGGKSVKDAYLYLTDPNNKEIPFDLLLLNAGKILIAGLTASGAIVLGEVISKSLSTIPFFAFQIPMLGSLGDILGIFLGAVACGIIGAIALHMIDKAIAKRTIENMTIQQIQKNDEILIVQERLRIIAEYKLCQTRESFIQQVTSRHQHAAQVAADMMSTLDKNHELLANI